MTIEQPESPSQRLLLRPAGRRAAEHLTGEMRQGTDRIEAAEAMLAVGAIALGVHEGRHAAAARLLRLAYGLLEAEATEEAVAELARSPSARKQ